MCELNSQLEVVKTALDKCQDRVRELEGNGKSYLGQVCQWVSGGTKVRDFELTSFNIKVAVSQGKEVLKKTVHNYLKGTQLDHVIPSETSHSSQVEVTISLSHEDLATLRRFILADQGNEDEIQDILARSYKGVKSSEGNWTWKFKHNFTSFLHHEGFVICQILLVSILIALAIWKKVSMHSKCTF